MSPLVPGQPVAAAPNQVTPQGIAQPTPVAAPTPTQLPPAPAIAATPPPVATPAFNTQGTMNAIANYYQIPRQTTQVTNQGQAQGNIAGQAYEKQKAENDIKIQNQQNALDPSKYQFVKNSDGSVTILNSLGDKVDIGTYASLTGANPAQALQNAGATDQSSQQFITAYNNMQQFVQDKIAAANGDTQANAELADFYKNNPGLDGLELGQLQTAFMNQYGSFFGMPSNQQGGLQNINATPTLTSANNPLTTSPYENISYFGGQENANPYAAASGFGNTAGTYGVAPTNNLSGLVPGNSNNP